MKLVQVMVAVILMMTATPARADDPCAFPATWRLPYGVNKIKINISPGINPTAMAAAIGKWNSCNGGTVPTLTTHGPADIEFKFLLKDGNAPADGCGWARINAALDPERGVKVLDGTGAVWIYEADSTGRSCQDNVSRLARTYAHEIGHIFGLGDPGPSCFGRIMGIPQHDSTVSEIKPADCEAASDVTEEEAPGSPDGDEGNEDNQCVDECGPGGTTPIVISLLDERYELTPYLSGVFFDIDASGAIDLTAWTARGSDDAFLVLDRNANGLIDDGSELFGGVTDQPRSAEPPNGFAALAVFDSLESEGNRDGYITSSDAVFDLLRLWVDANHNGRSDVGELLTLSDAGILFIDLAYGESRKVDDYGNEFRYWSMVGREHDIITMWDVILLHTRW